MSSPTMHDYRLCFVEDDCAYFTTANLKDMDGERWDRMFDSEAVGRPYAYSEVLKLERDQLPDQEPYLLKRILFNETRPDSMQLFPALFDLNAPTVKEINRGSTPWLRTYFQKSYRFIFAGITLANFIQEIERVGGEIYMKPADYLQLADAEQAIKETIPEGYQEIMRHKTENIQNIGDDDPFGMELGVMDKVEKLLRRKPGRPKKKI